MDVINKGVYMKKVLKVLTCVFIIISIINISGCKKKEKNKIEIITTNYPEYDFVRAITKGSNNIHVSMLLKPGTDIHDFEPTPNDIINIKKSNMFIYVGGESDEWIKDVLKDVKLDETKVIKLMDIVELKEEELVEGMEEDSEEENSDEEETEYDEHVWTSPRNATKIIESISKEIIDIDNDNKELYESNTKKYIEEINNIDKEIREVINNSKRKELIFGDRFPLRYFTDEYNLKYYAAFLGCSEQNEASAKTIAFLINKVKEDKIPVVFHIELSDEKIARTISESTGAKVLEFNSAHNISQEDFDKGITYVDIMKNNIEVLKEALN